MITKTEMMVVTNPYQGKARRVLCVCSVGCLRSPTLANELHKHFGYNTRAVGVEESIALIPITEKLIEWAQEIVCVNQEVYDTILLKYEEQLRDSEKPVYILWLEDDYPYGDEILKKECIEQYREVITYK